MPEAPIADFASDEAAARLWQVSEALIAPVLADGAVGADLADSALSTAAVE